MNTNEKARKKLTFSVIDFVIILVGIALIAGIIVRYDIVNKLFSKTKLTDAKVTFVAEALTPAQASALKEGTQFFSNEALFGTLHSVKTDNALIYSENVDGTLISSESSELLDADGKPVKDGENGEILDADGSFLIKVTKTDRGYLLGGKQYIAPGSQFEIKANGAVISITIISLTVTN